MACHTFSCFSSHHRDETNIPPPPLHGRNDTLNGNHHVKQIKKEQSALKYQFIFNSSSLKIVQVSGIYQTDSPVLPRAMLLPVSRREPATRILSPNNE